jgi:trehalose 6-phosphate synthase
MLDIAPDIFDRAYNRVANSALWFLLHQLFDTPNQPRFGREFRRDWESYLAYNAAFADALTGEAQTGEGLTRGEGGLRVLIQDYHLCLAPRLLRDRLGGQSGEAGIGHFCHTPWAPPDYYRMLPDDVGRALLDGILGADRAGFHAERWATAFLDCCTAVLGADVSRTRLAGPGPGQVGRVTYRGHVTEVAVHPLGVDAAALRERARAGDVRAHAGALRRAAGDRKLIVRVDRTELSKNIVRGLAAYRELLATRPQWRGRVVHLAFAYPSRSALAEYRAYTDQIRELGRQINEEFGTADWDPLVLEVKDDYPRSLAACALADVLLVNPIRDGMNLVAQEGPVLSERGCALVLSREAGAAATLAADALLVNPYDVTETADALHRALEMPDAERQRRGAALAATAAADPPARWLGGQLASLGPGS